jgi:hypothetical protein
LQVQLGAVERAPLALEDLEVGGRHLQLGGLVQRAGRHAARRRRRGAVDRLAWRIGKVGRPAHTDQHHRRAERTKTFGQPGRRPQHLLGRMRPLRERQDAALQVDQHQRGGLGGQGLQRFRHR